MGHSKTPLDYFLLFLDDDIDETCQNTNTYAEIHQDKYPSNYRTGITRVQFYAFLAIVTYMGANPRSDYFTYWSTDHFCCC